MSKVVRLPDTLADFLKKYPSTIGELVNQIEAGLLSLNVDVTALQGVTDNQGYDFKSMITEEIAALVARLEALESVRSEATAPANFTSALLQRAKEVAPIKLVQLAHMELPQAM
jgi:hypothetical protein